MHYTLPVSLVFLSGLAAQTAPCVGLNDQNNNVTNVITARNSNSPGEWGWQFKPAADLKVQGLKIYTGNRFTSGFMKLGIWSENATTNVPDKLLAEGTFEAPKNAAKGWVGTNLDAVTTLKKGTPYWIVWTEIGWSTPPFDSSGTTKLLTVRRFGSSSAWTKGSTQAFKCRIYCSMVDVRGTQAFGVGCSGKSTGIGTSFTNTEPSVGNASFRVEGTGLPAGANALLAMGTVNGWPQITLGNLAPGCWLNTDIKVVVTGKTGSGDVRSTSGASGHVTFNLPIANNSALKGFFVGLQIAAADRASSNAIPLVFTNATQVKIF